MDTFPKRKGLGHEQCLMIGDDCCTTLWNVCTASSHALKDG